MATLKKLPSGLWQAQVFRRGVRKSASFELKAQAIAWAGKTEADVMSGERGFIPPNLTVSDLLDRYSREVSAGKKGERWETVRINMFKRDRIASVRLRVLDAPHVSDWQLRRLQSVSGASVRRERNLLNHAFNLAVNEWKWLKHNPLKGMRKPAGSKPRDRIASDAEIALMMDWPDKMRRVVVWALETGMRASEIAGLREIRGNVAVILDSKNGTGREVPLSKKALSVWQDGGFGLTSGSISARFASLCKAEGLTFHDLRRTALTRLSKVLNPYELSKMAGHKDLNMVLNVYYRADISAIADRLN